MNVKKSLESYDTKENAYDTKENAYDTKENAYDMEKIEKIIHDERFRSALDKLEAIEKDRIFCGHDLNHLLSVARIAWIYILEHHLDFDKSVVYGAGLLHDVGKFRQYEEKIPHHIASADIAGEILKDSGYDEEEIALITAAILNHRKLCTDDRTSLNYILYMADKKSRNCFECQAKSLCDWPETMKNESISD